MREGPKHTLSHPEHARSETRGDPKLASPLGSLEGIQDQEGSGLRGSGPRGFRAKRSLNQGGPFGFSPLVFGLFLTEEGT